MDTFENAVMAGSSSLSAYVPVNPEAIRKMKVMKAARSADLEAAVNYRLNQTGNIFYASTEKNLEKETKALFDSVTVLFAAMTKALGNKNKTLFDYESWTQVIRRSGFFVEVQKFEKQLSIKSSSVAVNTQIVQQLFPGIAEGSSMDIAKGVLSALNGEFGGSTESSNTKVGHVLFICEEIFGAPSVTVRVFFASQETHHTITSSPCHKSVNTSFEQLQEANTFLFVDPDKIAQYVERFASQPEEYARLISQLETYVS
ncbi:Zygote formation protein zyg1 [Salmonella enterica]|nr:Zygote formation protein zyg1 [Salmonella enterica]